MIFEFTIYGNQENPEGNPIPYHRSTQGAKWNPEHKRYLAWKTFVAREAKNAGLVPELTNEAKIYYARHNTPPHPVQGNPHGRVEANIFFGNEAHADPDNIVKGILDAVFRSDKHIDVCTHHSCGNSRPRVGVKITLKK